MSRIPSARSNMSYYLPLTVIASQSGVQQGGPWLQFWGAHKTSTLSNHHMYHGRWGSKAVKAPPQKDSHPPPVCVCLCLGVYKRMKKCSCEIEQGEQRKAEPPPPHTHGKLETWAVLLYASACLTFHPRDSWHQGQFIKVAGEGGNLKVTRGWNHCSKPGPVQGFLQWLRMIAECYTVSQNLVKLFFFNLSITYLPYFCQNRCLYLSPIEEEFGVLTSEITPCVSLKVSLSTSGLAAFLMIPAGGEALCRWTCRKARRNCSRPWWWWVIQVDVVTGLRQWKQIQKNKCTKFHFIYIYL